MASVDPFHDRKASFKAPPAAVRDILTAQEVRRNRALEGQKRRRAERIDATRQLDLFADLSLGASDEDEDDEEPVREGVASFAPLLAPSGASAAPQQDSSAQPKKRGKGKRKGKAKQQPAPDEPRKRKKAKPSRWADKCMFAELLEMQDTPPGMRDGVPDDIERGWVAVTPVPVGKRCLAVTHQTSGPTGVVPNTTLRSRVLGKALMKPFPSALPPQTVLDCILDENWRETGLLHVLDVLQWKAQDLADCETPFRFWWRDTRLSELTPLPPPVNAGPSSAYEFPYPTTFVPIPYHTDTSLAHLASALIPLTRTTRAVPVTLPVLDGDAMDTDAVQLHTVAREVRPDGLLLYVAQATYEPGASPLSSWLPIRAYDESTRYDGSAGGGEQGGPLALFERLIHRRLASPSAYISEAAETVDVQME